jgi:hypothetical protein
MGGLTEHDGPVDVAAVLAEFDKLWSTDGFHSYTGRPLVRLADSEHDQPDTQGRNPYWDMIRQFPLEHWNDWGAGQPVQIVPDPGLRCQPLRMPIVTRFDLARQYAWGIPTPGDLQWIARCLNGRPVVEVGAGTGYWASQLSQHDVDVVAFDVRAGDDDNPWCDPVQYHPVRHGTADQVSEHPTRALLLCWPPHNDPMAADALRAYGGDLLVYVGVRGCCANAQFYELLAADWVAVGMSPCHVTFSGLRCYVTAHRRKGAA